MDCKGWGLMGNTMIGSTTRRGFLYALGSLGLLFGIIAAPASADDISVPLDNVIHGDPGTVHTVAETDVDASLVGMSCVVTVVAENQESENPNTDLIITSGDAKVEILGVEDKANGETKQSEPMVVSEKITVQVRIGKNAVASMGFSLSFACEPAEAPPANPVPQEPNYTG